MAFHPSRGSKKYELRAWVGGKQGSLGYFATAEEAALARARLPSECLCARPASPPLDPPRNPAGRKALELAKQEGLSLIRTSDNERGHNISGYKHVYFHPARGAKKSRERRQWELKVRVGGKSVSLGYFATAEQAALFYARREAGRDTSDLTAPPPPPPPPAPSSAAGAELG